MSHAAPVPGTSREPVGRPRTTVEIPRPPEVFDRRVHSIARIVLPIALGLLYGLWAAGIRRAGGAITGGNLLFGFVCAIVFAVLCIALLTIAPRLPRVRRALLWAVFTGIAFGFLYSQTGHSVLRAAGISIALAVAAFVFDYYRYYGHEQRGDLRSPG
ncbi:hypothetical protein [Streptomyces nodosus]|uniref:Uncharacterized protein n=1 Tax=Streptomyces nodosus TaxID=40318 RepID=A0A0B5DEJ2_9ACTN|nr:hypothetical protein [Streptomyces nodosus]AJE41629.1 hypothetical protein SNOD_17555 [Streptomyces nodosus]MBB4792835.1 multisubunit Na+/H+ antiporter MnhB subunit [Streptomyces nodosus]